MGSDSFEVLRKSDLSDQYLNFYDLNKMVCNFEFPLSFYFYALNLSFSNCFSKAFSFVALTETLKGNSKENISWDDYLIYVTQRQQSILD
jgi:hypothetical protein